MGLVKDLSAFMNTCEGISVFFVDKELNAYDSDINNSDLNDYRKDFVSRFRSDFIDNDKATFPKLSQEDGRNFALYEYDFEDDLPIFDLLKSCDKKPKDDKFPDFFSSKKKIKDLKYIVVRLRNENDSTMTFILAIYPTEIYKTESRNMFSFGSNRISKVKEDILIFPKKSIVLLKDGKFYIENSSEFERMLGFQAKVNSLAVKFTETIRKMDVIEDDSVFVRTVSDDFAFAKKLVKACKGSAVIENKVDKNEMLDFIKRKPYYNSRLKFNESGDKLDLKSQVRCKTFITLLDDDFLMSELTKENYIVYSKDRVTKA